METVYNNEHAVNQNNLENTPLKIKNGIKTTLLFASFTDDSSFGNIDCLQVNLNTAVIA